MRKTRKWREEKKREERETESDRERESDREERERERERITANLVTGIGDVGRRCPKPVDEPVVWRSVLVGVLSRFRPS